MAECRRPCRICRRWFDVEPRAGERHRVCGAEACQRERNRRSCRRWREEHEEEVAAYRLLEVLPAEPATPTEVVQLDPIRVFDPEAVRHAVPVGTRVVLAQLAKVLVALARHEVVPRAVGVRRRSRKVPQTPARHETPQPRPPP
jgi:hypothetical protein